MSWPKVPLRRLFDVVNGGTPTADQENWGGDVPWATPVDVGETSGPLLTTRRTLTQLGVHTGSTIVPSGSILVSTRAPIGYTALVGASMAFNQGCRALVPKQAVDARFFRYQLEADAERLQARGLGTTFLELSSDALASVDVVSPSPEEQRRIADFLDFETAQMDAVVSARHRMSGLLDERRISLTSQLVLGKAGSERDLEDSGIPPLGELPKHWEVRRNKDIMREVVEPSRSGSEELLTVSHITGVTPRSEKNVYMFMAESMEGYKICRPNDLVINTLWAWMGALGVSKYEGIVSPAYGVYRFSCKGVYPSYYDMLYRSPGYVCEMTRHSKGVWTSRLRLYPESFLSLKVPIPPLEEQVRIVERLEEELAPERRIQSALERSNEVFSPRLNWMLRS